MNLIDGINGFYNGKGKNIISSCYTITSGQVEQEEGCPGYRLPTEAEWQLSAGLVSAEAATLWVWCWDSAGSRRVIRRGAERDLMAPARRSRRVGVWLARSAGDG